jgi:hypothetical protein
VAPRFLRLLQAEGELNGSAASNASFDTGIAGCGAFSSTLVLVLRVLCVSSFDSHGFFYRSGSPPLVEFLNISGCR